MTYITRNPPNIWKKYCEGVKKIRDLNRQKIREVGLCSLCPPPPSREDLYNGGQGTSSLRGASTSDSNTDGLGIYCTPPALAVKVHLWKADIKEVKTFIFSDGFLVSYCTVCKNSVNIE